MGEEGGDARDLLAQRADVAERADGGDGREPERDERDARDPARHVADARLVRAVLHRGQSALTNKKQRRREGSHVDVVPDDVLRRDLDVLVVHRKGLRYHPKSALR